MQTVCVIGLGYIGLPTASLLATKGFSVFGCDNNPSVVETINQGNIHITENDLDVLVRSAVNSGQLMAYTTPQPADIFIIAVPTPFRENHQPDTRYVESAVTALAPVLQPGNLIILESTSPVGTTEAILAQLTLLRPDLNLNEQQNIYIAHCPERVLPGQIIRELVENDRIIGGINIESTHKAKSFYAQFVQGEIFETTARTAELAKLAENAFRDVNIAFANELSLICEKLDISVWELINLANRHPRVNILKPGPGVGGHCIAVDPWFIIAAAPEESPLLQTARQVNTHKTHHVIAKIQHEADRFKQPNIACLGLSYKANIDDLRESPALEIVAALAALQEYSLMVVEPHIDALPDELTQLSPNIELVSLETAIAHADIVVVLVDHQPFIHDVKPSMLHAKVVIDTRGIWV